MTNFLCKVQIILHFPHLFQTSETKQACRRYKDVIKDKKKDFKFDELHELQCNL